MYLKYPLDINVAWYFAYSTVRLKYWLLILNFEQHIALVQESFPNNYHSCHRPCRHPTEQFGNMTYEELIASGTEFRQLGKPNWWMGCHCAQLHIRHWVSQRRGVSPSRCDPNAVSNILDWDMPKHPCIYGRSLFLVMAGAFPWAHWKRAGTNVCLRKVDADLILRLIADEKSPIIAQRLSLQHDCQW